MIQDSAEGMTARLIDGAVMAAQLRQEIARDVAALREAGHEPPGLGVILIGENAASQFYVAAKTKSCQEVGFHSVQHNLPGNVSERDVLAYIEGLNRDPRIHGILVQMPLPPQVREPAVVEAISPEKDVDGFHPENAGLLSQGRPRFVPCTPMGVREMLLRANIETSGRRAVVIGRSNIVGRPMSVLLSMPAPGGDATVTLAHRMTANMAEVTRDADLIVVAVGRPDLLTADMVKTGATVIDVGINRVEDPTARRGYRIVGDVDFAGVRRVAGAITPVPGGVGPMTIAMLLKNTLEGAQRRAGLR